MARVLTSRSRRSGPGPRLQRRLLVPGVLSDGLHARASPEWPERRIRRAGRSSSDMRREPAGWTVLLSVTGAPFAPVSWTRLKGLRLGEQVVVSVLATVVLVGPYLVVYLNVEER